MTDSKRTRLRSKSLANEAKMWLSRGVRIVPIKPRSKKPAGGKGWNDVRLSSDDIDKLIAPGMNIGGLWGKPSKWVVDIDLDWDELLPVAPDFIPETYTYGREERPDSHYLLIVENAKTNKWIDPETKETIIELRSTGSQSVLPGSTHPDGDLYVVGEDRAFAKVSVAKITRVLDRLAAIALCARYYPSKGGRHDFIHALTGTLLHSGAKAKEARSIATAVLDAAGSKETDRGQRERTIENTIKSHRDGTTHGWKTLAEYLPESIIKKLKTWLKFNSIESVEIVTEPDETPPPKLPPTKVTKTITEPQTKRPTLEVPGLVGEIAKWSSRRSYVQQPLFDLAVGLWCTALATGNRYKIGNGFDTPLQPYFMLLAPTSGGKENATDAAFEFARKIGYRDNVFQGFQSYHVLADKVGATPSCTGWLWDEAARKLKSSSNPGSQDYQILTWLLKLYGKGSGSTPGLPARNEASSVASIDFPFFIVLATAQPAPFIEAISNSTSAFDTGLMNRFVLFDTGDGAATYNDQRVTLFPSAIKRAVERFKELPLPLEDRPQKSIGMSGSVFARFKAFRDEAGRRAAGGTAVDTLWGRANQNALILAGIVAVGIDPKAPVIDEGTADWAIRFIRWSIETWSKRLDGSVARNFTEARSKQIESYIRDSMKYATRTKKPSWRALLSSGRMPRAFLTTLSRHLRGNELKEVIETLLDAGIIAVGETDDGIEFYLWKGGV